MRLLVCSFAFCWAGAASATTVWSFDLPATGIPSHDAPYPTVATLTLTETADGVQFVLDPNEASSGFLNGGSSFVERVDFVYSGPVLTSSDFRNDGQAIDSFDFLANPNNMDSGYHADVFHIVVDFPSRNDPDRFEPEEMRTWTVLGATEAQFRDSFAVANNKASPSAGVISVTAYALASRRPTRSTWVAGAVPEPGSFTLATAGLALFAMRRRSRSSR
jgi:hypothetical protein